MSLGRLWTHRAGAAPLSWSYPSVFAGQPGRRIRANTSSAFARWAGRFQSSARWRSWSRSPESSAVGNLEGADLMPAGPPIDGLLHRLAECPPDFLLEIGEIDI